MASVRRFSCVSPSASQIQNVNDWSTWTNEKDLMISKVISRGACLAELTSNPKSFSNCPDLHGGVPGFAPGKIVWSPL